MSLKEGICVDADESKDGRFCPICGRESVPTRTLEVIITVHATGIRIEKLSKTTEKVR